nr:unnamed protein product [Callosobruchus chinensis]
MPLYAARREVINPAAEAGSGIEQLDGRPRALLELELTWQDFLVAPAPSQSATHNHQGAGVILGHQLHPGLLRDTVSSRHVLPCCRSIDCFGRGDNDLPFGSMLSGDAWLSCRFFDSPLDYDFGVIVTSPKGTNHDVHDCRNYHSTSRFSMPKIYRNRILSLSWIYIYAKLDKGEFVILLLYDLSKTFHTFEKEFLEEKLYKFGTY